MAEVDAIQRAYDEIDNLCKGKKWQMSIPVNEAMDSDCVIIDGIKAARLAGAIEALDKAILAGGAAYVTIERIKQLKSEYLKAEPLPAAEGEK